MVVPAQNKSVKASEMEGGVELGFTRKTTQSCPREISVRPAQPHTPGPENMYSMYMIWRYTHKRGFHPDHLQEEGCTNLRHLRPIHPQTHKQVDGA